MLKKTKTTRRGLAGLLVLALLVSLCCMLASTASAEENVLLIAPVEEESKTNAEAVEEFVGQTGIMKLIQSADYKSVIMILLSFFLMYLAIGKGFEPLLLLPIAFGMLLTNLPGAGMFHSEIFEGGHVHWDMLKDGVLMADGSVEAAGLVDILYLGVKLGIYPCLIFVGVGAMTDFGPLIANPKSLILGAAAQLGIFVAYIAAATVLGFSQNEAASIGIIGGADGPTAIYTTSILAPHLLGPIAIAATPTWLWFP